MALFVSSEGGFDFIVLVSDITDSEGPLCSTFRILSIRGRLVNIIKDHYYERSFISRRPTVNSVSPPRVPKASYR